MRMSCRKVEQITLLLENRPGILAELCANLNQRGVSIRAISTHESADATRTRLLVDQIELAKEVATGLGVSFTCADCLELQLANEPGAIAAAARQLALAGINIDYLYAAAPPDVGTCLAVFGVSSLERALELDWR